MQIAERISATVGADYFHAIAKHLAKALEADCVLIGEFVGGNMERVRSVAAVTDGRRDHFDYQVDGSAAFQTLVGKPCLLRSGAREVFPHDAALARLGAEACAGIPLAGLHDAPIGILLVVYRRPVSRLETAKSLLKIFAPRTSAELARKQEEERLRESEQRYRVFIEKNPIAMWRIEFEQPIPTDLSEDEQLEQMYHLGYVAEANESLAATWGVKNPGLMLGVRVEDLFPRLEPGVQEATRRLIRSGYRYTVADVELANHLGKRKHHIRTAWGILEDGKLVRIWGTTQDVTELKQSQRAVEAWERRVANLLEVVQLAVAIVDLKGSITYVNAFLKSLTRRRIRDLAGLNWMEALVPPDEHGRLRALMAAAPDTRHPLHFESTLLSSEGGRWWIAWDCTTLRDAAGEVEATILVGRDITEQRIIEEQYRQSQKLEGIGRLAGGIAHDFNNLLTVIVGYCALLLQKSGELDPPVRTAVEEIQKASDKGAELTRQLLAFSRRQVLRPQVLQLNNLVMEAEGLLRRLVGDDVNLTTRLDPAAGCVRADPGHLHQVLMNLVVNARDAMPNGGSVAIATQNVTVDSAHTAAFPAVPPGQYVSLDVADTGTGMTEEVRRHLFEPFFTTKERGKGTGMGLPMVYGIVSQTGGHILVESEPGKGSLFRILLPRSEPMAVPDTKFQGEPPARGGSETILVVEDHDAVRAVAARTLRGLGYTVLEAESPAHAIEMSEKGHCIELLLADVMMPGMSGSSLARLFLDANPHLKVLLMSGHTEIPEVTEKINESGLEFLRKPFSPATLASRVREVLDKNS